jgi:hypothetical protein
MLARRHVQFLIELLLLALLGAGLWYALGAGGLAGPDTEHYSYEYRHAIWVHAWTRFSILLGVGSLLLVIIYYGTSYAVTPFRIFLPFLAKFSPFDFLRRTAPAQTHDAGSGGDPAQEARVDPEELLDRIADTEMEDGSDDLEEVNRILRRSAHSSAKLASKMERRINTHLMLGVLVGGAGLAVWWMSFYYGAGMSEKSLDVSHFLMATLPRITILLFIELLAGFFLRQYRIGVEDLKYFLELCRRADARRIAYAIFDRLHKEDAKLEFAKTLMQERSDTRLASGETTTALEAMVKEENEIIKGLGVVGDKLELVAKAFKKKE